MTVAAATIVLAARSLIAERFTVDDVFIFLRYARNISTHGEFAFSPGGPHVEGTSSVAWTALLAVAHRSGWGGLGVAKALSLGVGLVVPGVCAFAAWRALVARGARTPLLAALPALALVLDADFATWIVSGMDTALWTLACVGCVAVAGGGASRCADSAALAPSEMACTVLLGALAWIRPEGPLFAAAGVCALARGRRSIVRMASLAALPVLVLTAARALYFHDLVANTVWAKLHVVDGKDYTGPGYIASALSRRPLLLVVIPVAALARAWTKRLAAGERVALGLLGAAFVLALMAGGDWMPNRRLLVVALPLAATLGPFALTRARGNVAVLAGVALFAEAAATTDRAIDQSWRTHERLDERVEAWRVTARPFVEPYPLDWMPMHLLHELAPFVAPGDVVSHVDMGELPYVMGDVRFLDGFGLVDREAARLAVSPADSIAQSAAREAFFRVQPAAAIVVFDETVGRPFSEAQRVALDDPRFRAGWRELSRVPTWGDHPCVVYVRRSAVPASDTVIAKRVRAWLNAAPDVR